MKFKDLRVEDLKKELNKLELSSTGNKAELQKRLLDEFERRGMNIDTYEFDSKDEVDLSEMGESNGGEVSSVAARGDDFRNMLAKMFEENFRRFEENSRITNEKLEYITEVIGRRMETVEVQIKELDKKVQSVDEKFLSHDHRVTNLEEKISELEIKGGPVRVPDNTLKIKPPVFDGSTSFNVFKLQFETVASRNSWNGSDKAVALLLALKGSAADVIQSIPVASRNNYEDVIAALERKYGGEHERNIYLMELRGRVQRANETLQDFAAEVERLVLMTYPGEDHPLLDRMKIETFVNGIRDPEIKYATYASPKASFSETVSFALAQETARIVVKPQTHKIRQLETEGCEPKSLVNSIEDAMRRVIEETKLVGMTKPRVRCYNCDKAGHIARECRAKRKRSRSSSPPPTKDGRRMAQQSTNESQLN
ncbi:uncharacterized protein LOC131801788 [Musca domestica]|uniref:Uncharacterized protein LOC131801788 n=1 Tax=Musca domestica TaxID=7370 RepID=A0ABM3UT66_MUSDO|nr:uncharacterized protein LOC131801788 [Musca domestica]